MLRSLALIFLFLLSPLIASARIDFVELSGVTHTIEGNVHILNAKGQTPLLFGKKSLPEFFDIIRITGLDYHGQAFLVWQPVGANFDPNSFNTPITIENGNAYLPAKISKNSLELIGIIFPVENIRFSDVTFGQVGFGEKISRLLHSHTPLLPSTINLITPKYLGMTPISKILGIIAMLLGLLVILYKRHFVFVICLALWLIWDLLYVSDQYQIVVTTYTNFVAPGEKEKRYFDLGDQYGFARKVQSYQAKTVGYYAPRRWPYDVNFIYHTYPTTSIWEGTGTDLIAVAGVPWSLSGSSLSIGEKILPGDYSLLETYSPTSSIFKRN